MRLRLKRERVGRLGGIWGCCEGKGEKGRGNLERANGVGQEGGCVFAGASERDGRTRGHAGVCGEREIWHGVPARDRTLMWCCCVLEVLATALLNAIWHD